MKPIRSPFSLWGLTWCCGLGFAATQPAGGATVPPPSPQRIGEISQMLAPAPQGFGAAIGDREQWRRLASHPAYARVVEAGERALAKPLPEQPDDLYLDFSRTGNRTRWQRVAAERRNRIPACVLAECVENKGRFIKPLVEAIQAVCAEPTWVMPAHDRKLLNFEGKIVEIDLASSGVAINLAMAEVLLADRLPTKTRALIHEQLEQRIFSPFRDMALGKRSADWWMRTTNNWNAVCLANVVNSALCLLPSSAGRAFFVACGELYSKSFLAGFPEDGYCTEGVGYWCYGFGHYLLLAEGTWQATGGKIDLMADEHVKQAALYGARIGILDGVCPAFADCSVTARPSSLYMQYINRRYRLGLREWETDDMTSPAGTLVQAMMWSFPNAATAQPRAEEIVDGGGLRDYFESVGILVARPKQGSTCRLGVALKGGNNAEHHNHNDVGSYVVALDGDPVLLDPGSEVYTARTFSKQRYVSKVLNSFGHPVPKVADTLQRTGREAVGEVLASEFSDTKDRLVLDISSAYTVPDLKSLQREFLYSREGLGSLTVTDRVEFASPQEFGTAIVVVGDWQQPDPRTIIVLDYRATARVTLSSEGGEIALSETILDEDTHTRQPPRRLGIDFTKPVISGSITVRTEPYHPADDPDNLVRNGNFEFGMHGWRLKAGGMGSLSEEQTASGTRSLKIVDPRKDYGSNITSAPMDIGSARSFELTGKVFIESGQGVGVYVRYLGEDRKVLNMLSSYKWSGGVITASGKPGEWTPFKMPFTVPAETKQLQIWIHSANAAVVTAYLDDLSIRPIK
ncbi:MAG: hypothetical protein HN380_15630 [Victivallales bacterium]|nr:hypothetical protein [Victivallales bacterium]